ncbi:MAG: hypothetical protein IBX55_07845 [Methyloprofundus sp.]|nr:hypothetical protein [Methyloprofundus sp.]
MHHSLNLNPTSVTRSVRRLDNINGKDKAFTPISNTYVPEHERHIDDASITQLIALINKLYALTETQQLIYKQHPHKFINTPSIVGIRYNKNTPYRIIRFERYKDYTIFRTQMNKLGFKFCVFKSLKLDGIFIKEAPVASMTNW